jgi:hypothetical protein
VQTSTVYELLVCKSKKVQTRLRCKDLRLDKKNLTFVYRESVIKRKPLHRNIIYIYIYIYVCIYVGPDSAVGIATHYGLDGPGIESRWGRDFSHMSRPALWPTQPPVHWVPGLSRG